MPAQTLRLQTSHQTSTKMAREKKKKKVKKWERRVERGTQWFLINCIDSQFLSANPSERLCSFQSWKLSCNPAAAAVPDYLPSTFVAQTASHFGWLPHCSFQ